MRNVAFFLLGVLLVGVAEWAAAAVSLSPSVPGYASGYYKAAAVTMTAANDGYIAQSVVNVAGAAVTVPATLRMAANAGTYALSAMRLNPWGIAGTLAAGWLLDQGLEYVSGAWVKQVPGDTLEYAMAVSQKWYLPDQGQAMCNAAMSYATTYSGAVAGRAQCLYQGSVLVFDTPVLEETAPSTSRAATDADWAGLPSPLSVVAPELPKAAYMPNGVPVDAPTFDFAPFTVPQGQPYLAPDGTTVQPQVTLSPNGSEVTAVTSEKVVKDAAGNPVSNATPTRTQPDLCAAHPDSVACMTTGGPPDWTEPPDSGLPADPSIVPVAGAIDWHQSFLAEGAGQCGIADASINVMGKAFVLPFSSLCPYLPQIRMVIIALATIVSIRLFALAPW